MSNERLFGTLQDFATQQNFDRTYQQIVEYQSQTNRILDDMIWTQCNQKSSHLVTVRQELPEIAWRMLNRGVKPGKSLKGQVNFTTGGMEALAQVDEREWDLNGYDPDWRMGENSAFQQAMNKKMGETLFYGDEKKNPAGFTGLGAYYYSTDKNKCKAADYVIDAGGNAPNALTSLWFVVWGQNQIFGIFPEGTKAGFIYRDNGRQKTRDSEGGELYVYESQYNWDAGLVVKDYRYAVRICNIDPTASDLSGLLDLMIDAYNRLEDPDAGRAAIYMNRTMMTKVDQMAAKKNNVNLTVESIKRGDKLMKVTHFWGIPIGKCDAILNTEGKVA